MKNALLLLILVGVGYYVYVQWFQEAPSELKVVPAKPEPVDFAIRSTVNRLFNEWKRRELAGHGREHGSAFLDMSQGIMEIRRKLFGMGIHSEEALSSIVADALRELGVADYECTQVASGILQEGQSDSAHRSLRGAATPKSSETRTGFGGISAGD
jgi:hypothetical protein